MVDKTDERFFLTSVLSVCSVVKKSVPNSLNKVTHQARFDRVSDKEVASGRDYPEIRPG